jgi:toxin YoeB
MLIKDIERNGYNGIGKPEPLRGELSEKWSVRIDAFNRIVFVIEEEKLIIFSCKGHYEN